MARRILLVFLLSAVTAPCWADVLAALTFDRKVVRLDELTGSVVPGWEIDLTGQLAFGSRLSGVATDGTTVYISSLDTQQVFEYNLQTGAAIGDGLFAQLPGPGGPGAVKIGPDDALYVAENNGSRVFRYNRTTGIPTIVASNLQGVGGLGFNSSGDLLSTDFTFVSPSQIYQGTGSPPPVLFPASQTSPLYAPNGILVRGDGSFLVADLVTNGIYEFSSAGMLQGIFSGAPVEYPSDVNPMSPPPGATVPSNFPADLVALPDGSVLLVTLGISSTIQGAPKNYGSLIRYSASGTQLERVEDSLTPIGAITLAPGLTTVAGDFNRDGAVTAADHSVFAATFGRQVTAGSNADGNRNGVIDAADYVLWRDALPPGSVASAAAVPEPATLLLAAAGIILLACRRSARLS